MGVRFQDADASMLYCIPESGCDLSYLVERYTCFERIAIPPYEVVAGCLGRAVRAGVMPVPVGGRYRLTSECYARAHRWDGEIRPSELAAMEFGDELVGRELPEVGADEFVLPVAEYDRAADHTREFLDQLFARHRARARTHVPTQERGGETP